MDAMDANQLLNQVKGTAKTMDEATRSRLKTSLQNLVYSMDEPGDTLHRIGGLLLQTSCVKVGFDLGLFKHLVLSKSPLSLEEICQKNGADPVMLSRILRYLAATGFLVEVSKDQYAANRVTQNLSDPGTEMGISHAFQEMPAFLKATGYKNVTDEFHTPFHNAFNTTDIPFNWFKDQPERLHYFNQYMALRRKPERSWLTVYPVVQETQGWPAEKPVYVNIGGGIGHQCTEFKKEFPQVPGRVINQDLAHCVENGLQTPGVEHMVHNFFEPQPVHGAKLYYMRGILHDHPPHICRKLLEDTKSAMTSESILLIDEMIIPDTGMSWYAGTIDLTMMCSSAGMERSEEQWGKMLAEVGLKLVKKYRYNPESYEGVMDVRLS